MVARRFLFSLSCVLAVAGAFQQPAANHRAAVKQAEAASASAVAKTAATAALAVLLTTAGFSDPALAASKGAAQISLDALPPSSISVQVQDLPVIGNLLSGTYTKVDKVDGKPSVTITSPSDKLKAIQALATGGHLEFDVNGIISTHADVDVAADEAGVLQVRVASNLIPPLPFKNKANTADTSKFSGKASPWNMVTNLGTGEEYYYNEKSGVTQFEKPTL